MSVVVWLVKDVRALKLWCLCSFGGAYDALEFEHTRLMCACVKLLTMTMAAIEQYGVIRNVDLRVLQPTCAHQAVTKLWELREAPLSIDALAFADSAKLHSPPPETLCGLCCKLEVVPTYLSYRPVFRSVHVKVGTISYTIQSGYRYASRSCNADARQWRATLEQLCGSRRLKLDTVDHLARSESNSRCLTIHYQVTRT